MSLATRFGRDRFSLQSDNPLSDEQIRQVCPSIFAEEKHFSRSDRYVYIPTSSVLQKLRSEGFEPFFVAQAKSREVENRAFTKHMIRLRHANQIAHREANEVILVNSHNGASSYQMLCGMFRFVCTNGLVSGDTASDVRVRHTGNNVADDVVDAAYRMVDQFPKMEEERDAMARITLSPREQDAFASSALTLRFDPAVADSISLPSVLRPRRSSDVGDDLWRVFNRVQESILGGGQRYKTASGGTSHSRAVGSVSKNVALNQALWTLAERMKELKA